MAEQETRVRLTPQQRRALEYVVSEGEMGATAGYIWLEASVRPWPTMDNLVALGLVMSGDWISPEEGYEYRATPAGMHVVAPPSLERKEPS